ncbi:MAG: ABC transporter permease [Azospirillaceae bacterium]
MTGLARVYLGLVLAFLYVPIALMAVMAFNASPLYALPIDWSGRWFVALAGNDGLQQATINSLAIAVATAAVATAIGTPAALALHRRRFRGRTLLQILLLPPITIPWLIVGTAMLIFFFWTGIGRGLHAVLIGHVALALPYVVVIVGTRLTRHGAELEEAAAILGATPIQAFFRVTVPVIAPGLVAAALFAFAVSFDQFVISYFLSSPGMQTLPVAIYSAIRKGFTPEINAVSTLVIVFSMVLLLAVSRWWRFSGEDQG